MIFDKIKDMKKIMFNDRYGLTEAIFDGRKTQTRRLVPRKFFSLQWDERDDTLVFENDMGDFIDIRQSGFVRYKVGEIVAVAQSYEQIYHQNGLETVDMLVSKWKYSAGWRNKMFTSAKEMPHTIRITDIRIERLQEISDLDCIREGVGVSSTDNRMGYPFGIPFNYFIGEDKKGCRYTTPKEAFAALIDKVSGRGTWERNPYVVVYGFELVK